MRPSGWLAASAFAFALGGLAAGGGSARAGVKTKAARETIELISRKFSQEVAEHGAETVARKVETLAARHGDDGLEAIAKVGPRAARVADDAGEHAADAVRLMARQGDDALWVAGHAERLALFARHGDDAAEAMLRHGELAEPLLRSFGQPAAGALRAVSKPAGRRLAMLADEGALAGMGRSDELLAVIGKHGDRAMDFVWRNKGALTVAAALAAFLADPEPFLDGTRDLAAIVAESAVRPLAEGAARHANWTVVLLGCVAVAGLYAGFRFPGKRTARPAREAEPRVAR